MLPKVCFGISVFERTYNQCYSGTILSSSWFSNQIFSTVNKRCTIQEWPAWSNQPHPYFIYLFIGGFFLLLLWFHSVYLPTSPLIRLMPTVGNWWQMCVKLNPRYTWTTNLLSSPMCLEEDFNQCDCIKKKKSIQSCPYLWYTVKRTAHYASSFSLPDALWCCTNFHWITYKRDQHLFFYCC